MALQQGSYNGTTIFKYKLRYCRYWLIGFGYQDQPQRTNLITIFTPAAKPAQNHHTIEIRFI